MSISEALAFLRFREAGGNVDQIEADLSGIQRDALRATFNPYLLALEQYKQELAHVEEIRKDILLTCPIEERQAQIEAGQQQLQSLKKKCDAIKLCLEEKQEAVREKKQDVEKAKAQLAKIQAEPPPCSLSTLTQRNLQVIGRGLSRVYSKR